MFLREQTSKSPKCGHISINHINPPQNNQRFPLENRATLPQTKNLHICQGTVLMHMLSAKTVETRTLLKTKRREQKWKGSVQTKKKQLTKIKRHQHHNMNDSLGMTSVFDIFSESSLDGLVPTQLNYRKAKWIISPNLGDNENDWNSHLVVSAEAMCRYWRYMLNTELLVLSKATCDEFSSCTWCGTVQHWPSLGKWRRPTYMNICTYDGPILQVVVMTKPFQWRMCSTIPIRQTISRCPCYPLHASTTSQNRKTYSVPVTVKFLQGLTISHIREV